MSQAPPIETVNHEVWIDPLLPRLPLGEVTLIAFYGHYPELDGRVWPVAIRRCFAVSPSGKLKPLLPVLDRRSTSRGGLGLRLRADEPGCYQVCLVVESGWWTIARDGTWMYCKPEEAPVTEIDRSFHTVFLAKSAVVVKEADTVVAEQLGVPGELCAKVEGESIVFEAPASEIEVYTPGGKASEKASGGRLVVEAKEHGLYLAKAIASIGYQRIVSTLTLRT